MTLKTWAVVSKDTGLVLDMFETRLLANLACYPGKMFVMETCEPLINVEFDDIDHSDAMDYCDAFISYAEHMNGTPLTDDELGQIPSDVAYDYLMSYLY